MALNISLFWAPWPIFFAALIVVIVLIIVLTVVERRIHKRVNQKKQFEQTYYQRKLGVIKTLKNDKDILNSIDEVAKEFLEEKYSHKNQVGKIENFENNFFKDDQRVNMKRSYSDLIDYFKERNDQKTVDFCKAMIEALYSGEKLDREKLHRLYNMLEEIIGEKAIRVVPQKVSVAPQKTNVGSSSLVAPMKPKSNIDKNSEEKIKTVLMDRKPIQPVKSQIDINLERNSGNVSSEESLGPEKEMKKFSRLEENKIEKRGFFSKLFGKKKSEVVKKELVVEKKASERVPIEAKKELPVEDNKPKVNMDLVNYIQEGLKRGFDVDLLKKKLIGAGFKKVDVENAAHFLSEKKAEKISPVIKKNLVEELPKKIKEESSQEDEADIEIGMRKDKKVLEAFPVEQRLEKAPEKKENRSLLARFFSPRNKDIMTIKREVERNQDSRIDSRPVVVGQKNVLNNQKEIIEKHGNIENMDDLGRVKKKIETKQKILTEQGYKGAELARID